MKSKLSIILSLLVLASAARNPSLGEGTYAHEHAAVCRPRRFLHPVLRQLTQHAFQAIVATQLIAFTKEFLS